MIYKLNYPALVSNFQQSIDSGSSLIAFDQYNMPFLYLKGSSDLTWSELAVAAQTSKARIPGYLFMQETSSKQKFHVV
ncbi:hypothetical protein, partial [Lysinibacillus sp. GbtcB16]|uniref:hypothetical protein n=1 Tax=Lysinibacillus sp. GbtcB16 TaxID=2824761 RepID=UPI001C30E00B